jgi:hypothetical protein
MTSRISGGFPSGVRGGTAIGVSRDLFRARQVSSGVYRRDGRVLSYIFLYHKYSPFFLM